jgi:signal transduction histidine kinase/ActR/RegA family two-component response regulator
VADVDGDAGVTRRHLHEPAHRDLADAREQFAATSEILTALGRSGVDPDAVLDTIGARATQLCGADASQIYLRQDGVFRLSRATGDAPEEFLRYVAEHPVAITRSSLLGRVALDRRTQQIPDVLSDPDYGRQDLQRLAGYRTLLSAPMIVDDDVVGVLSVWRTHADTFDQREADILGVFAAQAAVVIKTVDLVRAKESRSAELATKVEQLEALNEVGQVVSSTLNLDEVLDAIVMNAVRLTATDGGSILEYLEADDSFSVRSAFGSSPELLRRLRAIRITGRSTLVGRSALDRRPMQVADLAAITRDPHLQVLFEDGWRSVLAAPMLRQDRIVGALVIRRRASGPFPPDTIELLRTVAAQSALAVLNARLFREIETKSAELEVASRHKSEFLASMSHELRTPLNAVIGFSEVLLDRMFGDLNERQEEYLRDIWNSGRHLLELLSEILDLSKVEAGQMMLEPTTFEVAGSLEYALSLVRERAAAHGIGVRLVVAPDVGAVEADELRFRQVVVNLLSNAVKFTPDGGQVRLSAAAAGHELVLTVTDTGIGVPLEDRERIFESFQQGRRGSPKGEGTGLGLTLSRRIVELFQGRMWLDSEVGVGSTFGFAIPMRGSRPAPVSEPDLTGARPVVVMVDDDRASLDLVSAYLDGWSVDLVRAQDGVRGLEAVRRLLPAAVVLDIRLPGVDGWEVLQTLRTDPATSRIPVIVATIVDARARGLALGAREYLVKPVRRDDLVAALQQVGALPSHGDVPFSSKGPA